MAAENGIAAVCTPTAATLCVGADDIADVWINGNCALTCAGDFPYIAAGPGTTAKCVAISPAILDPLGNNMIAVRVRDTQPSEMWANWALDISCAGVAHSYSTSDGLFESYYDSSGSAPPPVQGGLPWTDPNYVPSPPWSAPASIVGSVYGQRAKDPQTGQLLTPKSWTSAGNSGNGAGIMYFRQVFHLTPEPTPVPPSLAVSASATFSSCGIDSGTQISVSITVTNIGGVELNPVTVTVTLPAVMSFCGPYSGTSNPTITGSPPTVTLIWDSFAGLTSQTATFCMVDYYIAPAEQCNAANSSILLSYSGGTSSTTLNSALHCCGSPTFTPTASPSRTETPYVSPTPTRTPSETRTASATITNSFSPTPSFTVTPSFSFSSTRTETRTQTSTLTLSSTRTITNTRTPTASFTVSPTYSVSPTISVTLTPYIFVQFLKYKGIYPTPFVDHVSIAFELGSAADVVVTTYNVAGELVMKQALAGKQGMNIVQWKGENDSKGRCASGVYEMHVEAKHGQDHDGFWVTPVIAR